MTRSRAHNRLGTLALLLLALAWAALQQPPGANQNAHLALVKSLSHGTPRIDRYRNETGDTAYIDGHYYAAKAPGLALVTLPWYLALRGTGLAVANPGERQPYPAAKLAMPISSVWEVTLFGATLPAFLLLLLARSVAERLVPGYGTAAAVALGGGSLLGVLATFFFAHALSACLGFAAFALLVRERNSRPDNRLVATAGLLAGLALVVEMPQVITATLVGLYAASRPPLRMRVPAYAGGLLVGIVPLAAFNTWAFGSPAKLSYADAVIEPGRSGHDVVGANSPGFFGVGGPSLRSGVELLFSAKGLFVLTPVWALAAVGLVALWRAGKALEAAVVGGLAIAFLLYNAAYYLPFGGFVAGPRFLVPLLPFLAAPVAAAWRASPTVALALALASIVVTSVALVAQPLATSTDAGTWFHRLEHGRVTQTAFHWAWGQGAAAQALPVLALVATAVTLALLVTPGPRLDTRSLVLAAAALVTWRILYTGAPTMLTVDRNSGGTTGLLAVLALVASISLLFVMLSRWALIALVPALMLLPVGWPHFAAHTGIALAAVAAALAGLAIVALRNRHEPTSL